MNMIANNPDKLNKFKLFHDTVTLGLACGLPTPQEWIRNMQMSFMNLFAYEQIPEAEQILWNHVAPDLYMSCNACDHRNIPRDVLEKWVYET